MVARCHAVVVGDVASHQDQVWDHASLSDDAVHQDASVVVPDVAAVQNVDDLMLRVRNPHTVDGLG